jgi:2-oxoglutarate ferredoxin oxidoreductase subunit beta
MNVPDIRKYLRGEVMPTPFCKGCGHGILMHAILIAIDELGMEFGNMLFVSGIGCAAWIPSPHFAADTLHTTHGRPIPFATGAKMFNPKLDVVVISGDGDLASIGGNHLIHAARRNTDITVIMANNRVYGMTGGQLASTTPHACITSTTPEGNPEREFDTCRLVLGCGAGCVARYSVVEPVKLRRVIRNALRYKGFSYVEALTICPTQFGRMNKMPTPFQMIEQLREVCVPGTREQVMAGDVPEGRVYVGEFS